MKHILPALLSSALALFILWIIVFTGISTFAGHEAAWTFTEKSTVGMTLAFLGMFFSSWLLPVYREWKANRIKFMQEFPYGKDPAMTCPHDWTEPCKECGHDPKFCGDVVLGEDRYVLVMEPHGPFYWFEDKKYSLELMQEIVQAYYLREGNKIGIVPYNVGVRIHGNMEVNGDGLWPTHPTAFNPMDGWRKEMTGGFTDWSGDKEKKDE